MCTSSLLWAWNTSLELEMRPVVSYTIPFRLFCCSHGLGWFGVTFRDCKFYASKYCVLLNLWCPLLIRRMMTTPRNW